MQNWLYHVRIQYHLESVMMAERLKSKGLISEDLYTKLFVHHGDKLMRIVLDHYKKKIEEARILDMEIKAFVEASEPLIKTVERINKENEAKAAKAE